MNELYSLVAFISLFFVCSSGYPCVLLKVNMILYIFLGERQINGKLYWDKLLHICNVICTLCSKFSLLWSSFIYVLLFYLFIESCDHFCFFPTLEGYEALARARNNVVSGNDDDDAMDMFAD